MKVLMGSIAVCVTVVAAFLTGMVGLWLEHRKISPVNSISSYLGDWQFVLTAPNLAAPHPEVVVALVDDDSLTYYQSVSPLDRRLLGILVEEIAELGPEVIALDLLFDRPQKGDADFIETLSTVDVPVVLGAVDERTFQARPGLEFQSSFLKAVGRPFGHVQLQSEVGLFETQSDRVPRFAAQASDSPSLAAIVADEPCASASGKIGALSDVVTCVARGTENISPQARRIAWSRPVGKEFFTTLRIPAHRPDQARDAIRRLMSLPGVRSSVPGSVVLVGRETLSGDWHETPFTVVDGNLTSGVFLHAHLIAQQLDGRSVDEPSGAIAIVICCIVFLACAILVWRTPLRPKEMIYNALGFFLLGACAIISLVYFGLLLPLGALSISWVIGGFWGWFLHMRWAKERLPLP